MNLRRIVLGETLLLVVIAAFALWQHRQLNVLRVENASLRRDVESMTQLVDENTRSTAAVARSGNVWPDKERLELMRLRGEVGLLRARLRRETVGGSTNALASGRSLAGVDGSTWNGQVSVRVGNGQTLVTGGWPTGVDKHAFLFVTPVVDQRTAQIIFRGECVEMTDDVLGQSGLKEFTVEGHESSLAGLYSSDQARAFREAMKGLGGVAAESVTQIAHPGGPTTFRLGVPSSAETRSENTNLVVELWPEIAPRGEVDLTVRSRLPRP